MRRQHVIVDGYNVLFSGPPYAQLAESDIDSARARLVSDLAGYAQGGPSTIVVFDGASNPASDGTPHHIGQLTVIFSAASTSADTVIEGLAARFRERQQDAVVVTSDGDTRRTVLGGTVSILSSEAFATEIASDAAAGREAAATGTRVPVAGRIDPDVSRRLADWSRGGAHFQSEED